MEFDFNRQFEHMMESNKLDTVILLAHMNPDGDAAGSAMGLAHYIRACYPQYRVLPYLADTLDKGPRKLVDEDLIFSPFLAPKAEKYAVIVCDTATLERMIGLEYYQKATASMVIDHHAGSEQYGTVIYRKCSEACAENIYYILDPDDLKKAAKEPHPNAADYLYLGILHDTGGFERANEAVLQAALGLNQLGVIHRDVMRTMHCHTMDDLKRQMELINMTTRVLDGKVAYVFLTHEKSKEMGIGYEDVHPIAEILRGCEDIELGFTMYEQKPGWWRCSFRSDGCWIDVNQLLFPFGGGGHAGAAGLRKETDDPQGLLNEILQSVKDRKKV